MARMSKKKTLPNIDFKHFFFNFSYLKCICDVFMLVLDLVLVFQTHVIRWEISRI